MPYKSKQRQREYQRLWTKRRRDKYIADKVCVRCKTAENLEFHHVDSDKKITHRFWSRTIEFIESELLKCVVLCTTCHQKIHNPMTTEHGTLTMYKRHKCRCKKCRFRNAEYEFKRRRRNK